MSPAELSLAELLEFLTEQQARSDALWNFFVSILIAFFGGLLILNRPLRAMESLIIFVAYGAFAYLNYTGLIANYQMRMAALEELRGFDMAANAAGSKIIDLAASQDLSAMLDIILYVHAATAIIVFLGVLYNNTLARREGQ